MSGAEADGGTVHLSRPAAEDLGMALLQAAGAPASHASTVMQHLLDASAMGLHSHGLMRVPQYLLEIAAGDIDPDADPDIRRRSPTRLDVDGRRGFGQVVGMAMVEALTPVAHEYGLAIAVGVHLGHTGRVGAYPEALARAGLIGLAACNGAPSGHWVAPFGGREGRISTNPMAFAWPVTGGAPVVSDFSTGATAEGVVRSLRNRGLTVPDGFLRDADGHPTTDPETLYGDPKGAIQPFGGALGYRGTALGLLVEVLTTLLSGQRVNERMRHGTDMTLLAVAPGSGFADLSAELSEHLRTTPPIDPARPVQMPGDRELLALHADPDLLIDSPTWQALGEAADRIGLALPSPG